MNMDKERAIEVFIAETLKEHTKVFFENREISDEDKVILRSLLRVIEYMSLHHDFKKFYEEKLPEIETALGKKTMPSNSFTVTCVEENSDGSANVEVEMGDEVRNKLFEEGLNFLLIKAILGGDTEDVLCWAQKGKKPVDNGVETVYI